LIQYLGHNNIDREKWDKCIDNSLNGMIYAYSWYLDIVCPSWDGLVGDEYEKVMPIPKAEKYGFLYTYPPPYIQQLGLFATFSIAEKDVADFLIQIPEKYKYIEMNLNEQNPLKTDLFKITKGITHLLSLSKNYKDILTGYTTQTKRNLKKAQASSLLISKNSEPLKIIQLFRNNRGKQYSHNSNQYETLDKLMQACIKKGVGESWGVYTQENELCAGAFFLRSNGRAIFLFSGANNKAYETHAMTFLINKYIEEYAGQNLIFDFEGSLDIDLARFYKGFGSTETVYLQIRRNTLPFPAKMLKEIQYKRKASSSR
jgi:hypothetical protein